MEPMSQEEATCYVDEAFGMLRRAGMPVRANKHPGGFPYAYHYEYLRTIDEYMAMEYEDVNKLIEAHAKADLRECLAMAVWGAIMHFCRKSPADFMKEIYENSVFREYVNSVGLQSGWQALPGMRPNAAASGDNYSVRWR